MPEEPQLNGRSASVINKLTNSAGWQAREELWNTFLASSTEYHDKTSLTAFRRAASLRP